MFVGESIQEEICGLGQSHLLGFPMWTIQSSALGGFVGCNNLGSGLREHSAKLRTLCIDVDKRNFLYCQTQRWSRGHVYVICLILYLCRLCRFLALNLMLFLHLPFIIIFEEKGLREMGRENMK